MYIPILVSNDTLKIALSASDNLSSIKRQSLKGRVTGGSSAVMPNTCRGSKRSWPTTTSTRHETNDIADGGTTKT